MAGVAVKVTVVPGQILPAGFLAIVTDGVTVACSERFANTVPPPPVVIPVRPGAADGLIAPAAEPAPVACTCKPIIVMVLILAVPKLNMFTVTVVAVMPPLLTPTISLPVNPKVGTAAVLNCQPGGAFKTRPWKPLVISVALPSVMVMLPNVVKPAKTPPTARLAQMLVPPPPGVTVIAALALNEPIPAIAATRSSSFFISPYGLMIFYAAKNGYNTYGTGFTVYI